MAASPQVIPVRPREGVLGAMMFTSGAVALVYEVAWQRQFALLFGSGGAATAAVLAAYFAGLGFGAWVASRKWSMLRSPLLAYAGIEAGIALGALLVAPLIKVFETSYPGLYTTMAHSGGLFTATRLGLAFLVLLVPTACMGATLPVLGQWVEKRGMDLGISAGWLYATNTAGAALGALAGPFVLFITLGVQGSVMLGAGLNLGLAALAVWLHRQTGETNAASAPSIHSTPTKPKTTAPSAHVGVLAWVSGFATFGAQVQWSRAFAQIHENSLHSFALIIAVVISALAVGAQLARLCLRRKWSTSRILATSWSMAGLLLLVWPWMFWGFTNGLAYLPESGGAIGPFVSLAGKAMLMGFPAMTLLGLAMPAIMQAAGNDADDTHVVLGRVLLWNIVGSVMGALAFGFVFSQLLGLWGGLISLGAFLSLVGLGQRVLKDAPIRPWALPLATALALLVGWPLANLAPSRVRSTAGEEIVLSLKEGTHGITAVTQRGDSKRLKLNNHYALGGTASTGDERVQAHVPMLLHPAPRRVAFLGLGTGISAGGTLLHPLDQLTVVELVPEVIDAARTHFHDANLGLLSDSRVRVVADDARNFLRGTTERFDLIIGDLVVPWRQGEGALFTLEQFQAARRSLSPDGVFCQWIPLFQLTEEQTHILVNTFLTVFPKASVWRGDFSPTEPALALVARNNDAALGATPLQLRLASMTPDPTNPQLRDPVVAWMNLVGILKKGDRSVRSDLLNTEDRPRLEWIGAARRQEVFTGRPLQAWFKEVGDASRPALAAALPNEALVGWQAGSHLFEFTLSLEERDETRARAAQEALERLLPPTSYHLLFGG